MAETFARIPESLLLSELSHGAVRLYAILDRTCGPDHTTWPSRTTLAARMRCTRTTVDRFIVELVDVGAITVTKRWDDAGDPTSNLYYLVARARLPSRTCVATPPHECDHGGHTDATTGSHTGATQNESQVEREPGKCVSLALAKLNTHSEAQRSEARVKIGALTAIHGEDALGEVLDMIPDASLRFAGELDRVLKAHLDSNRKPACERCGDTGQLSTGYICGCPASPGRRSA